MDIQDTIDIKGAVEILKLIGRATLKELAVYIRDQAYANAPVDTGYLRTTIIVSPSPGEGIEQIVVLAPYAAPVEFGHITSNNGYVPPNPFFRHAIDDGTRKFAELAASISLKAWNGNSYDSMESWTN